MCLICIQYDIEINFYYNKIWEYTKENNIHFEWLDQSIINPAVGFHASHWQKRMGDAQEIRTPIEGPRLPFYSSFYHPKNYSFDSCWYCSSLLLFCCFSCQVQEVSYLPMFLHFPDSGISSPLWSLLQLTLPWPMKQWRSRDMLGIPKPLWPPAE